MLFAGQGRRSGHRCTQIAHGKLLNAGQTCIAPDYVLLPPGCEAAFEQAFAQAVDRLFPTLGGNADYASIVTDRHHARLHDLLAQAQGQGARVVRLGEGADKSDKQGSGQPSASLSAHATQKSEAQKLL